MVARWWGVPCVCLLVGCFVSPDPLLWRRNKKPDSRVPDGGPADFVPVDAQPTDRPTPGEGVVPADVAVGSCSASGVPGPCDPIGLSGCAEGACYLLPVEGQACVCPAGTIDEGAPCNTTKLCKPGLLCAGTSPPGICREVCRSDAGPCPAGKWCRYLTNHPQFGYCDVVPDGGGPDT